MFILKHGTKKDKPFLKAVEVGVTGIGINYSEESKAMKFVSRGAAIQVSKALRTSFGNFYPVEVDG